MEYNTSRGKLLLPEYGRNVQNMIRHAMEIEDRDERNRAVVAIIDVMGQLNPHLRDVDDFVHKLWTHLFIMSDFQLDVDSPFPKPLREILEEKPELMPYPKSRIRYGHYGQYTQKILETAGGMENNEEREYLKEKMGNFMKKQFLVHNNNAVENNVIAQQMFELSKGELKIEDPDELMNTNQMLKSLGIQQNQRRQAPRKKSRNKKYKK